MINLVGLVQDYKSNIPLEMLSNKYKVPIHKIINVLYELSINKKGLKMENTNFKIGDYVFVKTRWNTSIEQIKRETATRFYTSNTKFYKENNLIVGCAYDKVIPATQEHFDMFAKNKLARQINDFDFNALSFNALKEINTLISMNKA